MARQLWKAGMGASTMQMNLFVVFLQTDELIQVAQNPGVATRKHAVGLSA